MTRSEYEALLQRPAIAKRNPSGDTGLRPAEPQPTQGHALERPVSRKDSSGPSPAPRLKVSFRVYAVRPCDWDGYHIKEIQDMLVHAGVLPDDNWCILQGEVISEKTYSKEEERTEIYVEPL